MLFKVSAALVLAVLSLSASALPSISTKLSARRENPGPYGGRIGSIKSPSNHKTTVYKLGDKLHMDYTPVASTSHLDVSLVLANATHGSAYASDHGFVLANDLGGDTTSAGFSAYFRVPTDPHKFSNVVEALQNPSTAELLKDVMEASQNQQIEAMANGCSLAYFVVNEHQSGPDGPRGPFPSAQAIVVKM